MNSETAHIPKELLGKVASLGSSVTPGEIDAYDRFRGIEDRSFKLKTFLEAWERQHEEERKLRKKYATRILNALCVQGVLVNISFFAIGFNWIKVEPWVANSFILAVFGEIAGISFFVVKCLFPKPQADVLSNIHTL